MKRVVVFGIFDGVHEGHRSLFDQAHRLSAQSADRSGQVRTDIELVAIVGRDSFVREFKKKEPRLPEQERMRLVSQEPLVSWAVLGDKDLSSWRVLERLAPDVICLGYDQDALEKDLKQWMAEQGISISIVRALYKHPISKV